MRKKLLALVLALCMALVMLSAAALAAGEEDSYFENSFFEIGNSDYEPWKNWKREDQGWSYDAATRTITLTNYLGPLSSNLIYEPLYIVLNGENTAGYMNGIPGTYAIENSVIRGDGTLNCGNLFVCVKGDNGGERLAGLTMESGTLDCDIGKQPEIAPDKYVNWGLAKLTVSGGTLHIHGGEGGLNGTMFGEKNLFSVTGSGTLILEGNKYAIELTDNADRYGAIISGLESATAVDRDGKPLYWKNTVETIQYPSGVSAKVHAARLYNADGSIATYAKITAGTPTTPEKPAVTFADVPADAYFAQPVSWAVEKGITNGTGIGKFSPEKTCTQGEILTFLWRANDKPEPTGTVSGTEYYAKAMQWAQEKGLTEAVLSPGADCTRANVVMYLWKLAGSPKTGTSNFTDVPAGSDYAQAVAWAVQQKITTGTGPTTFSPEKTCTRGEIVTFLYRAFAG